MENLASKPLSTVRQYDDMAPNGAASEAALLAMLFGENEADGAPSDPPPTHLSGMRAAFVRRLPVYMPVFFILFAATMSESAEARFCSFTGAKRWQITALRVVLALAVAEYLVKNSCA